MNKQPNDIDQILPSGEMLRGFMEQSFVTKSDLKDLLRSRGVFTGNNEKHDTVPILMNTLLSPAEFDSLRECQKSKEDNPKVRSQTIAWDSSESLIDSLPDNFNINSMIDLEFSNFNVNGSPYFIPVSGNPDHIRMDFSIERDDMSKNWASSKSIYPGSLEIQKISDGDEIKLVVTHTANETKYVANKASSNIIKSFKSKGCIDAASQVEKIAFNRFSNASRIEFFAAMTKGISSSLLSFVDLVDIEFSPDKDKKLPPEMVWMEKKIDDLKLNGSTLHQTLFLKEKKLHDYIILYRVDSKFKFDIGGLKGECVINIQFADYSRVKAVDSELEINVKSLSFNESPREIAKSEVKQKILKDIESIKISEFKKRADKIGEV